MANVKRENFERISTNRVNKIIDLISKLHNLSNTAYYEYSSEDIDNIFEKIQDALNAQKKKFDDDNKSGKKLEL